ncbi:hypothetical protein KHQ88_05630 [Mycoplasmatota bacterium]|nr:hypothetical protein KHQ88_05630 [Mycoplasmatota bacterium]
MQKLSKKLLLLSIMILTGLVIVSCGGDPTEEPTGEDIINHSFDMETVYYEGEDFEITYKDLYSSININDGIDQLLAMVDQELLKDFLDLVTDDQIDEKRIKLTYGTSDEDEIAEIDTDQKLKMERAYSNGMYVLGYNEDDVPYLKLMVARDLYVEDLLTNPNIEDNNIYLDAEDVADEYVKNKYGNVQALLIRYDTRADITQVFIDNDLVEYSGELRKYIGTTPLEEMPSYRITDDNTRSLSEDELLTYFIQFYNDENMGETSIDENASLEELLLLDDLVYLYENLKSINAKLGNLMFSSLSTLKSDSSISYYTYKPYEVELASEKDYYLVMNLDRDYNDLTDFEGDESDLQAIIGEDLYDEILQGLIEENLNDSSFIDRRLKALRDKNDFEIYDYYLKLDYDNITPSDMEVTDFQESDYVIASYGETDILVKDLMAYALERKAPLYLVHAAQMQLLRASHYDNVYCDEDGDCDLDYTKNDSEAMEAHIKEFAELEEGFMASDYTTIYSFNDYLYLAYGVRSDQQMIDSYVKRTLEPLYLYDYMIANKTEVLADMMTYINDFYENYFSLDASHILIYIDENNDGNPDDYKDFYEALDNQGEFDTMISNFKADVLDYLDNNNDNLAGFVSMYKAVNEDSETWGTYKEFGLKVLTENLSKDYSLTYVNSFQKYEEGFVDGLVDLFQTYQLDANNGKALIYSDLIETSYGLHIVKAEKGEDFTMPTAEFTVPNDTDKNYPAGLNNDNFKLSVSQLEVLMDYRIYDIASSIIDLDGVYNMERPDLPANLKNVFELFVENVHDGYYSQAFLNTAMTDSVLTGSLVDTSEYSYFTKAEIDAFLNGLKDVYEYQLESQFIR